MRSDIALEEVVEFLLLENPFDAGCVGVDMVFLAAPPRLEDDIGDDQRVFKGLAVDETFPFPQDLFETLLEIFLHHSTFPDCLVPWVSHEVSEMGHMYRNETSA